MSICSPNGWKHSECTQCNSTTKSSWSIDEEEYATKLLWLNVTFKPSEEPIHLLQVGDFALIKSPGGCVYLFPGRKDCSRCCGQKEQSYRSKAKDNGPTCLSTWILQPSTRRWKAAAGERVVHFLPSDGWICAGDSARRSRRQKIQAHMHLIYS